MAGMERGGGRGPAASVLPDAGRAVATGDTVRRGVPPSRSRGAGPLVFLRRLCGRRVRQSSRVSAGSPAPRSVRCRCGDGSPSIDGGIGRGSRTRHGSVWSASGVSARAGACRPRRSTTTTDAPNRLVPVCAEHAESQVLPSAGPVEDRLLATYLVEMVPDESVARIYADREVERQRVRIRHRRTVIALAALMIALVGTFAWGQRPVEPGPTAAVEATVETGPQVQNGVQLPLERSGNGLISSPRLRVLLLTPDQFGAPRCGRVTATDVVPAECADPVADVFVEDVGPAGAHREGTCSDSTVVITRRGDRVLCWRFLPRSERSRCSRDHEAHAADAASPPRRYP